MLSIIVAHAKNNVIGRANDLPWHLPADLARFKQLTTNHAVIMGRRTFQSIVGRLGQPLPNRSNIVLTRDLNYESSGAQVVHSADEAIKLVEGEQEAFIIGGAQVFKIFLPKASKIYLTDIDAAIAGDTYFPKIEKNQWQEITRTHHEADGKNQYSFDFVNLKRK